MSSINGINRIEKEVNTADGPTPDWREVNVWEVNLTGVSFVGAHQPVQPPDLAIGYQSMLID